MTSDHASVPEQLARASSDAVVENHPLKEECTFRLGGTARYFCSPPTPEALRALWLKARELSLPAFVLGGGSNVLFRDEGFPGVVISTKKMRKITAAPEGVIQAGAGHWGAAFT